MISSTADMVRLEAGRDELQLRELMRRYQAAEAAAITQLVTLLSPRLLGFFIGAGEPRDHAEDLLQECWLRIHQARHTYRPSQPLLPWVFAIARHTRLDGYRRRRRVRSRELTVNHLPEDLHPPVQPEAFKPEEVKEESLAGLLECLPASQREVIVMLKVSGMSIEEVARATSSTVGAVKQRAHRAYATLRARWNAQGRWHAAGRWHVEGRRGPGTPQVPEIDG